MSTYHYTGREIAIKEGLDEVRADGRTIGYGYVSDGTCYRLCLTMEAPSDLAVIIGHRRFFISTDELIRAAVDYTKHSEGVSA